MDRRQRKLGRLSLARAKVALVAINIISALVIIKLHNEASSRNLSSNLELENHVDNNIHLPPTHKGQGERDGGGQDWDTSNSDAGREGGNASPFLLVNISLFQTHVRIYMCCF